MKTLNNKTLALCLAVMMLPFMGLAQKYVTMTDGAWNNTTNVWSTDGGTTPCSCTPGSDIDNIGAKVSHNISMSYDLTVKNNGALEVDASGILTGATETITVEDGTMDVSGSLQVNKLLPKSSSVSTISGVVGVANGNIELEGTMTFDGASVGVTNGNVKIISGGFMTIQNFTMLNLINGNIEVEGQLHFDNSCANTQNGNIKNTSSGIVSGSGGVSSSGNVQNDNIWSVNVDWCAVGNGQGLPIAEDCSSNNICNNFLPVEYAYIRANATQDGDVLVEWKTTEEINNQQFIIQRSADGSNFEAIGVVFPEADKTYEFTDVDPTVGTWYYRLEQMDNEGGSNITEVMTVQVGPTATEVQVYPNPFASQLKVNFKGISGETINVNVFDLSGKVVLQKEYTTMNQNETMELDLASVQNGMYIVKVTDALTTEAFRVIKAN